MHPPCPTCGHDDSLATAVPSERRCARCGRGFVPAGSAVLTLTRKGAGDHPQPVGEVRLSEAFRQAYELGRVIGRGAMGMVVQAKQRATGQQVAVKFLAPDASDDLFQRFRREAALLASLRHPNVLRVIEVGISDGRVFLVTELALGGSLRQTLVERPMTAIEAAWTALGCLRGLAVCHRRGILHRDLKPENVLVTHLGQPMIADFSLAKDMADDANLTRVGAFLGTPMYMAPEQIAGEPAAPASDVYAIGAILFEMLSGRPPFEEKDFAGLIEAKVARPAPPLASVAPAAPKDLAFLVDRALHRVPRERPTDAGTFDAALRRAMGWAAATPAADARSSAPAHDAADGPPRLTAAGTTLGLPDVAFIGRDPACHARVDDQQVSAYHALFVRTSAGPRLIDLKSTNGTCVFGGNVGCWSLEPGDLVQVGSRSFEYRGRCAEAPAPSGPPPQLMLHEIDSIPLEQSITWIGRGLGNHVRLNDARVSAWHAIVVREPTGGCLLLDLRSSNGTKVNHRPVFKHQLKPGDLIEIGEVKIRFVSAAERAATADHRAAAFLRGGGSLEAMADGVLEFVLASTALEVAALHVLGPAEKTIVRSRDRRNRWPGQVGFHGWAYAQALATLRPVWASDVVNLAANPNQCITYALPQAGVFVAVLKRGAPVAVLAGLAGDTVMEDRDREVVASLAEALGPALERAT